MPFRKRILPFCSLGLVFCLVLPASATIITSTTTDPTLSTLNRGQSVSYVHTGVDFDPLNNDLLDLTLDYSGKIDFQILDNSGGNISWKGLPAGQTTIDLISVLDGSDLQGGTTKNFHLSLGDIPSGNYALKVKNKARGSITLSSAMTFDPVPLSVPEPYSILLLGTGLGVMFATWKRGLH